jgi:hypothetical protein
VLFDEISGNLRILCFHGGIIVNIDNGITYNGENYEFPTASLHMSLNELSRMLYNQLDRNIFEITWRMLQTRVNQACYVGIPIYYNENVNSIFRFVRINMINMLELYLNSRPRRGNSFSMELTWVPGNS